MQVIELRDLQGGKIFNEIFPVLLPYEKTRAVDDLCVVTYRQQQIGIAKIIALNDVTRNTIMLDTFSYSVSGKCTRDLKAQLRKDVFIPTQQHIILQYTVRDINNQETLMQDWWTSVKENSSL